MCYRLSKSQNPWFFMIFRFSFHFESLDLENGSIFFQLTQITSEVDWSKSIVSFQYNSKFFDKKNAIARIPIIPLRVTMNFPKTGVPSMSIQFGSVKKYFFDRPFFQKYFFDQKKSKNRVEKKKFATFFFASWKNIFQKCDFIQMDVHAFYGRLAAPRVWI